MEKYHPLLEWTLGIIYLVLIVIGLWKFGGWALASLSTLTPGKLAITSLFIVGVPFVLTLILAAATDNAANSTIAYLTVGAASIAFLGLMASAVWYVVRAIF